MGETSPMRPAAPRSHGAGRRRAAAVLLAVVLIGAAAAVAWVGAERVTAAIEARDGAAVRLALATDYPWARVRADGLQVVLTGTAPDEGARLRAVAAAVGTVGRGRIRDDFAVATARQIAAPSFRLEIIRNADGLALTGLVPGGSRLDSLGAALRARIGSGRVSNLAGSADWPAPEGWDDALAYAYSALAAIDWGKVTVAPHEVSVTALTEDAARAERLTRQLQGTVPEGVALHLDITAPRPVIAPYVLRFSRADGGDGHARLETCAADSDAARARIIAAATAAGADADAPCTIALGAPGPQWADAAVPAIAAVAALGSGTATLSNREVLLEVPDSVAPDRLDAEAERLRAALPAPFHLTVARDQAASAAVSFTARQGPSGTVQLRGSVPDAQLREAVKGLARARFARVEGDLEVNHQLPQDWTVRVIAALDAMAGLHSASVEVTDGVIRLQGVSGDPDAARVAASVLADRLGPGAAYEFRIAHDPRLDPASDLPGGDDCVVRANDVLALSEIGFIPGSAHLSGDVQPTLDELGKALADCGDFRFELGGHTDGKGSAEGNRALSQQRADAVRDAMRKAGIDVANITTRGYGAARPVAGNDTEAGREANRRIEFRLLSDQPAGGTVTPQAAPLIRGTTGTAIALPAAAGAKAGPADVPGSDGEDQTRLAAAAAATGAQGATPAGQGDAAPARDVSARDAPGRDGPAAPVVGTMAPVPPVLAGAFSGRSGTALGAMPVPEIDQVFTASLPDGYTVPEQRRGEHAMPAR